jgi:hypothetical protein
MPVARKLEIRSGERPETWSGVGDEVAVADANDLADLRIVACDVYVHLYREAGRVGQHLVDVCIVTTGSASSPRFPSAARWKSNLPSFLAAALASSMYQATYRIAASFCRFWRGPADDLN